MTAHVQRVATLFAQKRPHTQVGCLSAIIGITIADVVLRLVSPSSSPMDVNSLAQDQG